MMAHVRGDGGGMAAEVGSSWKYLITFCCHLFLLVEFLWKGDQKPYYLDIVPKTWKNGLLTKIICCKDKSRLHTILQIFETLSLIALWLNWWDIWRIKVWSIYIWPSYLHVYRVYLLKSKTDCKYKLFYCVLIWSQIQSFVQH